MTIRNVTRALTAGVLTLGVAAGASVARAQDYDTEPKGHVTLVGCFLHIVDPTEDDPEDMIYVLANPKPGPATSVPDASCSADAGDPILELTDVKQRSLDKVAPGRWMEIDGELERERSAGHLREFDVKSYREVPVIRTVIVREPAPAAVAKAAPAPAPAPIAPEPVAIATSGVETLPKTASPLPLVALLGAIALSGGFALTVLDRPRRRARR